MKTLILGVAALVLATSLPAAAQTYRSDARQYRQNERIERGYQNGRLTPREAYRLERQKHRKRRARALNGGYIDPRSQARIERMQDRADRNIYRNKRDRQSW